MPICTSLEEPIGAVYKCSKCPWSVQVAIHTCKCTLSPGIINNNLYTSPLKLSIKHLHAAVKFCLSLLSSVLSKLCSFNHFQWKHICKDPVGLNSPPNLSIFFIAPLKQGATKPGAHCRFSLTTKGSISNPWDGFLITKNEAKPKSCLWKEDIKK